jgi:Tol biopolymer transport system component
VRAVAVSVPVLLAVVAAGVMVSARQAKVPAALRSATAKAVAPIEGEWRLKNVRQLTFGGENAEAYFSFDGQRLTFQSTREGVACDQIFTMRTDGSDLRRVSSGEGRTTCSYYTPDGNSIVYASTHLGGKTCPPKPGFERGYVWPVYHSYDVFRVGVDGSNPTRLTQTDGYDAEATIGPGGRIVFTSVRDGDMELYTMNADGTGVKRITNRPGPDGGAFFSKDGKTIVWRAKELKDQKELAEYRALLKDGLWRPTDLEIFVADADGSNVRQVTNYGGSSFAPFLHPDGTRLVFASNMDDPKGRNFDLYLVNIDGTGLERVTFNGTFDGFPMWSPDGTLFVFASNRYNTVPTDTNIFIAEWVDKR